jgi:uroporphyrin-III C-methyltransferase/precorrin-2 dehydrogenase/sirohydrochlorin ferrochelatase
MGLLGLTTICRELIHHGMSPSTKAALVQQGTLPNQRVLIGNLETLPAIVEAAEVRAPTLIIVGEVVQLHQRLSWFDPVSPGTASGREG